MTTTLVLLLILILLPLAYWLILARLHETKLPNLQIFNLLPQRSQYKALIIFPHPDDEVMFAGGLLQYLIHSGKFRVTAVSVTAGEKGDELLKLPPPELALIRRKEYANALSMLGVKDFTVWDFPDNALRSVKTKLGERLEQLQRGERFDLIVTFERGGVYGHPDHQVLPEALSEMVTRVKNVAPVVVLKATLPQKLKNRAQLPTTISGEPIPKFSSEIATMKFPCLRYNWRKYAAAKHYKSQVLFRNVSPLAMVLLMPYEYYTV